MLGGGGLVGLDFRCRSKNSVDTRCKLLRIRDSLGEIQKLRKTNKIRDVDQTQIEADLTLRNGQNGRGCPDPNLDTVNAPKRAN